MNPQVKIFEESGASFLEKKVNKWLSEFDSITIISTNLSTIEKSGSTSNKHVITIFYTTGRD